MKAEYLIPEINCSISIEESNLLEQEGLKIVHCPNQFETHSMVIDETSLIGQTILRAREKGADIDYQIDSYCQHIQDRAQKVETLPYRQLRFPVGELCPIQIGNDWFCLAAMCDSDSRFNVKSLTLEQYLDYWDNLWSNLTSLAVPKTIVNVPVPGGRFLSIDSVHFTIEQRIAVIALSYFKAIAQSSLSKELHICVLGDEAKKIQYENWERVLLPFLHNMAQTPIRWSSSLAVTSPKTKTSSPAGASKPGDTKEQRITEAQKKFCDDLRLFIMNIDGCNGKECKQKNKAKVSDTIVDVKTTMLLGFLQKVEGNPQLMSRFVDPQANRYDGRMFLRLLGFLHRCTKLFGDLNGKSLMALGSYGTSGLGLVGDDNIPREWNHLSNSVKNAVKAMGQAYMLIEHDTTFIQTLLNLVPTELQKDIQQD